jgi:hypothetical protein
LRHIGLDLSLPGGSIWRSRHILHGVDVRQSAHARLKAIYRDLITLA